MRSRELVALGASSRAPTRERSQNPCVLRWDGIGILFDPGEGARRPLTLAGVSAASIHAICITHFSQRYGDAQPHLRDAQAIFPDLVALNDLDRLSIARRWDSTGMP